MCNPLKSHKTAKGFFGNPWRKQAEIWKCLEKSLEAGTRRRDAGAPFATLEARRGSGPHSLAEPRISARPGFGRKRPVHGRAAHRALRLKKRLGGSGLGELQKKGKRGKSPGVRERSLSAAFLERAWSERKPRGQRPRRLQREDIGCGCLCDHGGLGAWAATISARAGMCRQPGTLRRAPR